MWVPSKVITWLTNFQEAAQGIREDNAALHAENMNLKVQLATSQNQFDWLRQRVNALEFERAQLIKVAYKIDIPVQEIVRNVTDQIKMDAFAFEDIGDEAARAIGLPTYGT
jgi:hypothetical protein